MNQQILIIVNPYCHQGHGWKRWLTVRKDVLNSFPCTVKEIVLEAGTELSSTLPGLLRNEELNCIISAGGDGSIHHLVNTLLKSPSIDLINISIGAIGLGSSNDFLKPFNRKINNIPLRTDFSGPVKHHDVGLATYCDENNQFKNQYFVVNASVGVSASANWYFNNPGKFLRFLKTNSTGAAILYTAVATILRYKNLNCFLKYNTTEMDVAVSNINILKSPFVSGGFWYNQDIAPDDSKLRLNICRNMHTIDLLKILSQLGKGKFNLGEKTIAEVIDWFHLSSKQPLVFECDGETSLANHINISVVPKAIKVLSR